MSAAVIVSVRTLKRYLPSGRELLSKTSDPPSTRGFLGVALDSTCPLPIEGVPMFRLRALLFATVPLLASFPAMAANFAVGTCKPRLTSFSTISDAVASVPPGSTIQACPGVYPEQITISQPLTLQGIASGGQDQIVITVPNAPLSANVISMFGEPVAAQVLVQSAGAVNITNITVDGTGGDQACLTSGIWLSGIFYATGSSGEVDQVRTSGQTDEGCGVGIWAENAGSSNRVVNIHDSSIHDVDGAGVFIGSGSTPTLTAFVRENFISAPLGSEGVMVTSVNGVVTQNNVTDTLAGIFDLAPGVRVSHNTINDAALGLDQVPADFHGSNRFANTGLISSDGCSATPLVAGAARVQSPTGAQSGMSSPEHWRTPANPFGSRR